MENKNKIFIFGTLGIIAIIVAGTIFLRNTRQSTDEMNDTNSEAQISSSNGLIVGPQSAGDSVVIDAVKMEERGFIAVHLQEDGEQGLLIGNSSLIVSEATDVTIPLGRPVVEGEVIYVSLYTDVNDDGELLFDTDNPVLDNDGNIIMEQIIIGPEAVMTEDDNAMEEESVFQDVADEVSEVSVNITSQDYFFDPATITVNGGTITVTVTENLGDHTFVIDELGVNEVLETGKTFSFEAEPGTYAFYCNVGNHRALGMEGTLIVE